MTMTPCGRSHQPAPPQITRATPLGGLVGPSDYGDDEGDARDVWLQDARVLELDLDRPEIVDARFVDCDFSGVVAMGFVARRVELTGTRLRGVTLAKGQFDDGLLIGCVTSELSFRFSRLRRVVFRDCDLSGADFYNAAFDHVSIENCDLQRARFEGASVSCLAISNCMLAGLQGVTGLRGARLDASDLPALSISLAQEIGIVVHDD